MPGEHDMSNTRLPAWILALILIGACGACQADGTKGARAEIQSRYDAFNRAYIKKDFKTVGETFSADCVMKLSGEGRSMKAARAVGGMQAVSKSLTVSNVRTQIISIKADADTFQVNAIWSADSKYVPIYGAKDDPPRQGTTKQFYQDTWKRVDGAWRITRRTIGDADDEKPAKGK
jgi:hypothetical protein